MAKIEIVLQDGSSQTHDLMDEKATIGRLPDNSIQIDDASVSSHHAEITFEQGEHHVHDLGSTNGTFVNDEQISHSMLNPGDMIRFGKVDATYIQEERGESQPLPETEDVEIATSASSKRPENFKNSSPFVKSTKKVDGATIGIAAVVVVSLIALGYAVVLAAALQM